MGNAYLISAASIFAVMPAGNSPIARRRLWRLRSVYPERPLWHITFLN